MYVYIDEKWDFRPAAHAQKFSVWDSPRLLDGTNNWGAYLMQAKVECMQRWH